MSSANKSIPTPRVPKPISTAGSAQNSTGGNKITGTIPITFTNPSDQELFKRAQEKRKAMPALETSSTLKRFKPMTNGVKVNASFGGSAAGCKLIGNVIGVYRPAPGAKVNSDTFYILPAGIKDNDPNKSLKNGTKSVYTYIAPKKKVIAELKYEQKIVVGGTEKNPITEAVSKGVACLSIRPGCVIMVNRNVPGGYTKPTESDFNDNLNYTGPVDATIDFGSNVKRVKKEDKKDDKAQVSSEASGEAGNNAAANTTPAQVPNTLNRTLAQSDRAGEVEDDETEEAHQGKGKVEGYLKAGVYPKLPLIKQQLTTDQKSLEYGWSEKDVARQYAFERCLLECLSSGEKLPGPEDIESVSMMYTYGVIIPLGVPRLLDSNVIAFDADGNEVRTEGIMRPGIADVTRVYGNVPLDGTEKKRHVFIGNHNGAPAVDYCYPDMNVIVTTTRAVEITPNEGDEPYEVYIGPLFEVDEQLSDSGDESQIISLHRAIELANSLEPEKRNKYFEKSTKPRMVMIIERTNFVFLDNAYGEPLPLEYGINRPLIYQAVMELEDLEGFIVATMTGNPQGELTSDEIHQVVNVSAKKYFLAFDKVADKWGIEIPCATSLIDTTPYLKLGKVGVHPDVLEQQLNDPKKNQRAIVLNGYDLSVTRKFFPEENYDEASGKVTYTKALPYTVYAIPPVRGIIEIIEARKNAFKTGVAKFDRNTNPELLAKRKEILDSPPPANLQELLYQCLLIGNTAFSEEASPEEILDGLAAHITASKLPVLFVAIPDAVSTPDRAFKVKEKLAAKDVLYGPLNFSKLPLVFDHDGAVVVGEHAPQFKEHVNLED